MVRIYSYVGALLLGGLAPADRERGDVPGWVMVTLMSAILVVAILVPFRNQVLPAIKNAIDSVTSAGG